MKKWLSIGLKMGVSIGILALIVLKTDVRRIATLLSSVGGRTIWFVLVLGVLQSVVTAYRWVLVMRGVDGEVTLWPALQALYVSLALNQCTPSYIGGDAYRIYWLYREGNRLAIAARGVMIDRVSAVIALVLMMLVGLPLVLARFPDPAARGGLIVVLACGVVGTIVFFGCDVVPEGWRRARVVRELGDLSAAARRVLLHGSKGVAIALLALVVHLLAAIMMFAFAESLRLPLTLLDCLLLMPPTMLLAAVPVSVAGWGVREGVIVAALSMIGIGTERALALSVLVGVAVLANALIGLWPLAFGGERFVTTGARYAGASSPTGGPGM